jgi:DNA-binding NarL/FixJ family response regulator
MDEKLITVVIADDHPKMRRGIRTILEKSGRIQVLAEAGDGREALALVHRLEPDILILDVEMPEMNGLEVARQLKQGQSSTRFLALSAYDDPEYIQEMFANNASAYLIKDEAPRRLVEVIDQIIARSAQRARPLRRSAAVAAPTETTLTPREVQYLRKLAESESEQALAAQFDLPLAEVRPTLISLYAKLGVADFAAARAAALQLGLR